MNNISFELESNEEIWELIDQNFNNIFLHKFNPYEAIQWWNTNLKINNEIELQDIKVRDMSFDLQTDLDTLKQILELNTNQLRIYQFDKPVPDSLILEYLPEKSKSQILKQNGLKNFIFIDFEIISINSFDSQYLKSIEENPKFAERIQKRRANLEQS